MARPTPESRGLSLESWRRRQAKLRRAGAVGRTMTPLEAPPSIYESKRDLWLVLVLWGANLAMLFAAADVWRSPLPLASRLSFAVLMIATTFFVLWLLYSTRYLLTNEALVARCGPFRTVVPLAAIEAVAPSRSPLASPACSRRTGRSARSPVRGERRRIRRPRTCRTPTTTHAWMSKLARPAGHLTP